MGANLLPWIGQVVLGLAFLAAAYGHAVRFGTSSARPGTGWFAAVGRDPMRTIGGLEILAVLVDRPCAMAGDDELVVPRPVGPPLRAPAVACHLSGVG
jgi:hypothetical protein